MKDIYGYENLYAACENGMIWSYPKKNSKGMFLSYGIGHNGYAHVVLHKNGTRKTCRVSRLILKTFIPNNNGKNYVNHKNGIKTDNRIDNLEWVTLSENMRHAVDVLGFTKNEKHRAQIKNLQKYVVMKRRSTTKEIADKIRSEYVPRTVTGIMLSKKYSVSLAVVQKILGKKQRYYND